MENKQVMLSIIGVAILIVAVTGVTFAFFNYTRTGAANTVTTGQITFESTQSGTLHLTNMFPVKSEDLNTSNLDAVTITIKGNTTYDNGEEYLISLVDVNNEVGGKEIPIKYIVTATNIGTSSDSYFTARGGNTTIYKLNATGTVSEDEKVLMGYITKGATGVNGSVQIKAYIDGDRIAITDTNGGTGYWVNTSMTSEELAECVSYLSSMNATTAFCQGTGTITVSGDTVTFQDALDNGLFSSTQITYMRSHNMISDYTNGTTNEWIDGRTVFTTEEWNSLQSNGVSFRIKVESNEGTWIEDNSSSGNPTGTEVTPTVTLSPRSGMVYTGSSQSANTATVSPDGGGAVTYTYYTDSSCTTGGTTTAPTSGNWYVKATVAGVTGVTTSASSDCVAHSIGVATPNVSLSAKTTTYTGSAITSSTATVSPNGGGAVTYTYYTDSSCTTGGTTTAPTNVGTYYVKASVAAVSGKTTAASSNCVAHKISKAECTINVSRTTVQNYSYNTTNITDFKMTRDSVVYTSPTSQTVTVSLSCSNTGAKTVAENSLSVSSSSAATEGSTGIPRVTINGTTLTVKAATNKGTGYATISINNSNITSTSKQITSQTAWCCYQNIGSQGTCSSQYNAGTSSKAFITITNTSQTSKSCYQSSYVFQFACSSFGNGYVVSGCSTSEVD